MVDFETNMKKMEEYQKEFERYNRIRKSIFRKYFKIYHRYEVIGLENIPEGPALIAANHSGGFDLDIVALGSCTHPTREIQVLIVQNWHYLNHAWGRYWVGSGIPLWTRGGTRYEYIDPYLDKNGKYYPSLVAIYPEGHSGTFKTRHVLHKFFPGVVRIALRYKIPIVPAAQIGFHSAAPILAEFKHEPPPDDIIFPPFTFPVKLKTEFGAPFELSEYYDEKLSKEEEFRIANEVVRPKVAEIMRKHTKVALQEPDVGMKKPGI